MSYFTSGWDCFSTKPGETEEMFCKVCNQKMEVQRGVEGPTSLTESMAGRKHLHDSFSCKDAMEKWHRQMLKLYQHAEETPSQSLARIYRSEALGILASRKPTKDHWGFY